MNLLLLPDGRLRAGWRVVLAIGIAVIANSAAGFVAAAVAGSRYLVFDLVYRPLTMLLLVAGFSVLMIVADRVSEDVLSARELEISVMGDLWHLHPRLGKEELFYWAGQLLAEPETQKQFQIANHDIQ